jgi:hypothetical protein
MRAWYLATPKSATYTEAIHPTVWNEQESIMMSFCVIFNTTIQKGTKNTHNLINYLCLIVVIHKDVHRFDVAMDNFWITWQQIRKRLFSSGTSKSFRNSVQTNRGQEPRTHKLWGVGPLRWRWGQTFCKLSQKLTFHAQANMSYHELTYRGHVRLLIAKMRT